MRRSLASVALAISVLTALPHAQDQRTAPDRLVKRDRVDLSGQWEVAGSSEFGVLGKSFTAKQDATSLTLETQTFTFSTRSGAPVTTPGPPLRRTYAFNGVETRETFPMPASLAATDPTRLYSSYTVSVTTRAAWRGDLLVAVTHSTMRNNRPKHVPPTFDSEQTVRLTLTLDPAGMLVAERVIIADPDSDSQLRMEPGQVVKTIYKKVS